MAATTLTVKDATATTQSLSVVQDGGNSNALVGKHSLADAAGTNAATVKAASTAPAATDTNLVVGLTPQGVTTPAPGTTTALRVSSDGVKATYGTGANSFTLPATPSDVVEIKGSATKTVRIKKIVVSGVATTAKQWPVQIIRRAASIADGVAVTCVAAAFDSGDAAATAVVRHFTTLGTPAAANPASSVLWAADVTLTAPATAAQPLVLDFCTREDKALILRGVADCVVINLGAGALVAGEKLTYSIEWEEDNS